MQQLPRQDSDNALDTLRESDFKRDLTIHQSNFTSCEGKSRAALNDITLPGQLKANEKAMRGLITNVLACSQNPMAVRIEERHPY